MPSSAARLFIFSTNELSEPLMYSAIATAASFALEIAMHLIIVSTFCFSPTSRYTCEPPIDAAYSLTLTSSVRFILPLSSASNIKRSVITLVTLAIGSSSSLFFSYNICPVAPSMTTAAFEVIFSPYSSVVSAYTGCEDKIVCVNNITANIRYIRFITYSLLFCIYLFYE